MMTCTVRNCARGQTRSHGARATPGARDAQDDNRDYAQAYQAGQPTPAEQPRDRLQHGNERRRTHHGGADHAGGTQGVASVPSVQGKLQALQLRLRQKELLACRQAL